LVIRGCHSSHTTSTRKSCCCACRSRIPAKATTRCRWEEGVLVGMGKGHNALATALRGRRSRLRLLGRTELGQHESQGCSSGAWAGTKSGAPTGRSQCRSPSRHPDAPGTSLLRYPPDRPHNRQIGRTPCADRSTIRRPSHASRAGRARWARTNRPSRADPGEEVRRAASAKAEIVRLGESCVGVHEFFREQGGKRPMHPQSSECGDPEIRRLETTG